MATWKRAAAAVTIAVAASGGAAIAAPARAADGVRVWPAVSMSPDRDPIDDVARDAAGQRCAPAAGNNAETELSIGAAEAKGTVVAAWIQDAADGIGYASSQDGGSTFRSGLLPEASTCSGGDFARAGDPWVTVGSDGVVYVASITLPGPLDPLVTNVDRVQVSRSVDGGRTWKAPVTVAALPAQILADKDSLAVDPADPARLAVTWTQHEQAAGVLMVATSDDHGETWSAPSAAVSEAGGVPINAQVHFAADGSIVVAYSDWPAPANFNLVLTEPPVAYPQSIYLVRSADGTTWGPPRKVATYGAAWYVEPDGPHKRIGVFNMVFSSAVQGNDVLLSWFEGQRAPYSVMLARCGPTACTTRTLVTAHGMLLLPTVQAASRGSVAVSYYDLSQDVTGDDRLTTVPRMAVLGASGRWVTVDLAPAFDLRQAYAATLDMYFLGDYMAVAATGRSFYAAYASANSATGVDAYMTRVDVS